MTTASTPTASPPPPAPAATADEVPDRLPVRAVQRAFELLAEVGSQASAISQSELARRLGLPMSTVARLLSTLEGTGFVRKDDSGRFLPGVRLMLIGLSALRGSTLYDLADPFLHELAQSTGETANLAARADGQHWIYLRQVLSRHAIHHASRIGRVMPVADTAVGAALSGDLGPGGYAARCRTFEPDVCAVAAPIVLPSGVVAGALSVSGPYYRLDETTVADYGARVARAARELSLQLGGAANPG